MKKPRPVRVLRKRLSELRSRLEDMTSLDWRRLLVRHKRRARQFGTYALITSGALLLFVVLPWLIWKGPYRLDAEHLDETKLKEQSGALVTGLRTAIVAFTAALGAGIALLYTARTYRLTRRGQITDRFTKALERLGSSEIYVRIGGILALEQIVQDAPEQAATDAARVLGHFIRHRAPKAVPASPTDAEDPHAQPLPDEPAADVQAALTALTRPESRTHVDPRELLDLHGLHLAGAQLTGADLTHANLRGATLTKADLRRAMITKAHLRKARLTGADLSEATLTALSLYKVALTEVILTGSRLTNVDLGRATLTNVFLNDATLNNVSLAGARLSHTVLSDASLTDTALSNAQLTTVYLDRAVVTDIALTKATLTDVTMARATLTNVNLDDATLTDVNLAFATLHNALATDATLTNVDLTGATLTNVDLTEATLANVNLTEVEHLV